MKMDVAAERQGSGQRSSGPADDQTALSVLVVEDDVGVQKLIRMWLESQHYTVVTAATAEEAVTALESTAAAIVICDIKLPGHDGLWLVDWIRHALPETAVIMATGLRDVAPAVESLRQGVIDYLTKPFARDRLQDAVGRAAEWHRSAADARRWRDRLERDMQARHARLVEAVAEWPIDSDDGLDRMLRGITSAHSELYAHAYRVAALSVSVARALGLNDRELTIIEQGSLLHDIGKLAVPDALLRKPAPLSVHEQSLVRQHPALAFDLVQRIPYVAPAAFVVRDAHERVDGLGYPRGSRGDEVWIGARTITVADAYDTMIRPRVFRDAMSSAEALRELDRCSGTQFDPRVVSAFIRIVEAQ